MVRKRRNYSWLKLLLAGVLLIGQSMTWSIGHAVASSLNTNLTGWVTKGDDGTLSNGADGMLLTSAGNFFAMSGTTADDFIYEADVTVRQTSGVGALVFRSNDSGWGSYMLQIDPRPWAETGLIRLKDANGDRSLGEYPVAMEENGTYHLKVKAEGSMLQVFWGENEEPVVTADDNAYSTGYLGLQVWNSSMLFQNIYVTDLSADSNDLTTNLKDWTTLGGMWLPHWLGIKGTSQEFGEALRIAGNGAADFVLEGDVTVDPLTPGAAAGLLFRSDKEGTNGYILLIKPEEDAIELLKKSGDEILAIGSGTDIHLDAGKKHHIELTAEGSDITVYVDGYAAPALAAADGEYSGNYTGMTVMNGTAYFQDIYSTPINEYYTEMYRPQVHYSPSRGAASDPNGLVYFEGEYHLFHQDGGRWAHAVSTDLMHWKRLPVALQWNELGHIWSGSAVADLTNASGLFGDSGGKGLIAYYTSFNPGKWNGNQKIGVAFSKDKGRTWEYYEHDAIIPNPGGENGGWDFRDPKVVRDDEHDRWIMAVSGGDHIRLFTSTDLLHWTWTDNFGYGSYVRGGVWECPDLFQLPVDGNGDHMKWVLMISTGAHPNTQGSDAEYFVGQITPEGKFVNDNPAGNVLRTDFGKEMYASMSFYNAPDNRRIILAWMTNWDYPFSFPTIGWKGQMTIPRELSLRTVDGNVILAQKPVSELESIREEPFSASDIQVKPQSANILEAVSGNTYEIEAELELPGEGAASEFGFRLREGGEQQTVVGYRSEESKMFVDRSASGRTDFTEHFSTLHEAALKPVDRTVKMRIVVDESSVEAFGNEGEVVFSDMILPDSARSGMSFYAIGGTVTVKSINVYPLRSVWRNTSSGGTEAESLVLDRPLLELGLGETRRVFASVLPYTALVKRLIWESSDTSVVEITKKDDRSAYLQANSTGTAVITAKTKDGTAYGSMVVVVGEFVTNLNGWSPYPASQWVPTADGIKGSFDKDSNYMSTSRGANFTYEADLMISENGGAGSMLFRANTDGTSGYYFNVDPNMRQLRLFYKANGQYEDRQTLAKVPMVLETGRKYHVKIITSDMHIQIYFDGKPVIDLYDDTFRQGYFGLNVFGGEVYYQNVNVSDATPVDTSVYRFVNVGTGGVLGTESQANFSRVQVQPDTGADNQKWLFYEIGDGAYTIRIAGSEKSLDWDTGQNIIQLYPYLGYDNQRWRLIEHEDGTVTITSKSDPDKALEAGSDGDLHIADRADADNQRWSIERGAESTVLPVGKPRDKHTKIK